MNTQLRGLTRASSRLALRARPPLRCGLPLARAADAQRWVALNSSYNPDETVQGSNGDLDMRRQIILPTVIVLAILAVEVLWISAFFIVERSIAKDQLPFDEIQWKTASWTSVAAGENRVRGRMVKDLLAKYDFHGWQKEMVVALLGTPNDEIANRNNEGLTYSYYRLDGLFDYLRFRYNGDNQVVDYQVSFD